MTALRTTALAVFFAVLMAVGFAAQAPPRVDFQRDVQPILRDHCYAATARNSR